MARVRAKWDIKITPSDAVNLIVKDLKKIDDGIFKNTDFSNKLWKSVARQIGKIVDKRFKTQGPGWKKLKPDYLDWKKKVVKSGKRLQVGRLGKRKAKFTEIGQLTGALRKSATKPFKEANIVDLKNTKNMTKGSLTYAIDLQKIPYAKSFDNDRPFFFLDNKDVEIVMTKAKKKLQERFRQLAKE